MNELQIMMAKMANLNTEMLLEVHAELVRRRQVGEYVGAADAAAEEELTDRLGEEVMVGYFAACEEAIDRDEDEPSLLQYLKNNEAK